MAKYLYNFYIKIKNIKQYRFNTLLKVVFWNLEMFITILFWIVIYESNGIDQVKGFDLKDTITYFLVFSMLSKFLLTSSGFYYNDLIRNGKLNGVLLKPYSINLSVFFGGFADAIIECIPQFIFVLILVPFLYSYISFEFKLINFIFLTLFILISAVLSHIIWSVVGCLAFWLEEAIAVMWSVEILFSFMSGEYLPLDFFPDCMTRIVEFLPWSCFGYIPTKIVLGHYNYIIMLKLLSINVFWVLFFGGLYKMLWKKGNKYYSAIGG